jgi:hypothetical protein
MSISDFGRYALGFCAAFAILSGCGSGAQSQLAPSGSFQQSSAQSPLGQLLEGLVNMAMSGAAQTGVVVLHPDHGRSWMAPDAATHALLYVSDYGANDVFVYSYPDDKLVGTLTGFKGADGICVDKKGDVWIVNNNESHSGEDAVEYKHGGKKPIATLEIGAGYAVRCSVDPTTGNLAATVIESYGSGPGYVAIFAHAKGTPKTYTPPNMSNPYYCGYDDKGNLYVDGTQTGLSTEFILAELPKGKPFKDITLKGGTINFPGNIRWDGKYVAVGDQDYQYYPEVSAIYQTTGGAGKIVGKPTVFASYGDISGFSIYGKTVIGPDWCINGCTGGSSVGFYNYPAGGKPTKTLKNKNFVEPLGSAISQ